MKEKEKGAPVRCRVKDDWSDLVVSIEVVDRPKRKLIKINRLMKQSTRHDGRKTSNMLGILIKSLIRMQIVWYKVLSSV